VEAKQGYSTHISLRSLVFTPNAIGIQASFLGEGKPKKAR